jgi:hypothetical protein
VPDRRYGSAHQKTRAEWEAVVQAGQAYCCEPVCVNPPEKGGRWIPPDVPGRPTGWHLAHTDDGLAYKGPAHAGCNLSEAGRRGNPKTRPSRTTPRRSWRPTRAW